MKAHWTQARCGAASRPGFTVRIRHGGRCVRTARGSGTDPDQNRGANADTDQDVTQRMTAHRVDRPESSIRTVAWPPFCASRIVTVMASGLASCNRALNRLPSACSMRTMELRGIRLTRAAISRGSRRVFRAPVKLQRDRTKPQVDRETHRVVARDNAVVASTRGSTRARHTGRSLASSVRS